MYLDIVNKINNTLYIYGWSEINGEPPKKIRVNGEDVSFLSYPRPDVSTHLNKPQDVQFGFEFTVDYSDSISIECENESGIITKKFTTGDVLNEVIHENYFAYNSRINSKIAAIIVTYNRCDKLEASIDSIFNATLVPDELIVVNNKSTDQTPELLKKLCQKYPQIYVVNTQKNIGGAGGFTVGLKVAHERLATHFWIMDDDGLALKDSLLNLKSTYDHLNTIHPTGFICSRVDWIDQNICEMNQPETAWNWMRLYSPNFPVVQVDSCSFVSCLFSRAVLEDVGLPIHEFFIWFDDAEFTKRISKKYPCFAALNSTVIHDTPVNQGVYFARVVDGNIWKYKYGAVNESWYRFKNLGFVKWLGFVKDKNKDMKEGKVKFKHRMSINLCFLKGVVRKIKVKKIHEFNLLEYIKA